MCKIVPALGFALFASAMCLTLAQPDSRAVVASAYDAIRGEVVEPMAFESTWSKPFAYETCQDAHAERDGIPMDLCRELAMHCAYGMRDLDLDAPGLECWSNPTLRPSRNRIVRVTSIEGMRTIVPPGVEVGTAVESWGTIPPNRP